MPRKTKKQKLKTQTKHTSDLGNIEPVKREFHFSFDTFVGQTLTNNAVKNVDKSFLLYDSKATMSDLTKTLLLAIGIFSLELVIYWALLR